MGCELSQYEDDNCTYQGYDVEDDDTSISHCVSVDSGIDSEVSYASHIHNHGIYLYAKCTLTYVYTHTGYRKTFINARND